MTPDAEAAPARKPRLLVISTQGLQRFVPALGALGSIRAYHHGAHIVLLTARATTAFAGTAPYFDDIWTDETDGRWRGLGDLGRLWSLRARLRAEPFDRVYDLDANTHSRRLFWLMHGNAKRADIAWSGVIKGTALAYTDPRRGAMHIVDRWAAQLKVAGIPITLRPDMSWVARQVQSFTVPFSMTAPFVIIAPAPGPTPKQGPAWTPERYAELARALAAEGQIPVLVGPDAPPEVCQAVAACPTAVDLTGRATINEMVFLAWAATAAVGPDNGVMHLTAAAGCPTVVLYDNASDPALVGQRGNKVTILRRPRLDDIPVGEAAAAVRRIGAVR